MRQFDVIVNAAGEPSFTDPDLGWFFNENRNEALEKTDAEWIVFAESSIDIDREFLNELAQAIDGFPMVDAFAPRIRWNGTFTGGLKLSKKLGLIQTDENMPAAYVAAAHPALMAFSRRIIQRTGRIDEALHPTIQMVDYAFRMLHAGGKMFSIPYLVAGAKEAVAPFEVRLNEEGVKKSLYEALYKSFGFGRSFSYGIRHTSLFTSLFRKSAELKAKREAANVLSKLKDSYIPQIEIK